MKIEDHSLPAWILANQIKTENGKLYDLKAHGFLFDILTDDNPKQVWYKAAQVGGTVAALMKLSWFAKRRKMDAIYTMPSASDVKTLVRGKFNRIIANNPCMQGWIDQTDTIEQKVIGDNIVYFRGTFTEQQAISVTSDLNIYDEEDRSKQDIIDIYASRLDHSQYKGEWHFSNPSVEGNGVSRYWRKSDQKEWFIKCPKCKKKQYLSWPESICMERQVFQCKFCKEEISDQVRKRGEWVQKYKDKEFSGYHISQMMVTWKSAKDIIEAYETKPIDIFYNFTLGLPYVGEGNRLEKDDFMQNVGDHPNDLENCVIGCDSGNQKHFVIGNKYGLFTYGVTESWDDIARLLMKYKKSILVVDAMPDITGPQMLQEKFPNRVFRATYSQDRASMELVRFGKGSESGRVLIDRNRMIQFVVDEMIQLKVPVQGREQDWEKFYTHWDSMYRDIITDARGNKKIQWESNNDVDHWCHAQVYWRAGMTRFGSSTVEPIGSMGQSFIARRGTSGEMRGNQIIRKPKKKYDWRNE